MHCHMLVWASRAAHGSKGLLLCRLLACCQQAQAFELPELSEDALMQDLSGRRCKPQSPEAGMARSSCAATCSRLVKTRALRASGAAHAAVRGWPSMPPKPSWVPNGLRDCT